MCSLNDDRFEKSNRRELGDKKQSWRKMWSRTQPLISLNASRNSACLTMPPAWKVWMVTTTIRSFHLWYGVLICYTNVLYSIGRMAKAENGTSKTTWSWENRRSFIIQNIIKTISLQEMRDYHHGYRRLFNITSLIRYSC